MPIDITRDIYTNLIKWKDTSDLVLLVEGARQVGKTYIVRKFANENFKSIIYINLVEDSGAKLLDLIAKWSGCGDERELIVNVLKSFNNSFTDDNNTVVIIDEIQESCEVFNKIRSFNRLMNCRFIVTGSYLGRVVLDNKFWLSDGDTYKLTVRPLTFKEFLGAIDSNALSIFNNIDLYGSSPRSDYELLKGYFKRYLIIGGYPAVVKSYITNKNLNIVSELQNSLLQTFAYESAHYLGSEEYTTLISTSFKYFASLMLREKKGLKNNNLAEEMIKLEPDLKYKVGSLGFSKTQYSKVLSWLLSTQSIYGCNKAINCNLSDLVYYQRFYFNDTGILFNLLVDIIADSGAIMGILNENYVCCVLKDKNLATNFGVFGNYEIDFVMKDLRYIYGIEVKAGKSQGKSILQAYKNGTINKVLYLKGDTYGGVDEDKITIPIYLFERFEFFTDRNSFIENMFNE